VGAALLKELADSFEYVMTKMSFLKVFAGMVLIK